MNWLTIPGMKIEWSSNVGDMNVNAVDLIEIQFTPDGRRRIPPPSTIHGWLAKWRGTLTGNEILRNRVSLLLFVGLPSAH